MKRSCLVLATLAALALAGAPVWAAEAAAPHTGAGAQLVKLVGGVVMLVVVLLGSAAFALFWEGVLEQKIARGLATLQTRLGLSAALGFAIVIVVMALGKLAEGKPGLAGLVLIVALLALWLLSLGLVSYARWVGQRYFADGRMPALATAKGMLVVLLMGVVFPVGTFALLLLGISGLGAIVLSWRGNSAAPTAPSAPAAGEL